LCNRKKGEKFVIRRKTSPSSGSGYEQLPYQLKKKKDSNLVLKKRKEKIVSLREEKGGKPLISKKGA